MDDLMRTLFEMNEKLSQSIAVLRKHGEELAKAENNYQMIKAQTVAKMKCAGASMTEINLSIKGQADVAEAMLARDMAQVMYDTNKEHINAVKLQLRIIESQISREWNNG